MKSIRVFLTVSIIATITLIVFLSVLRGYQSSMEEAEKLFDSKLLDTVQLLQAVSGPHLADLNSTIQSKNTVLQIWQDKEAILFRTQSAPKSAISKFESGFGQANFNYYRWRTLSHFDTRNNRWIFLAERTDTRYMLAENIVLKSIIPTVLALPLLALIIWFVTGYGLKSLNQLATELEIKQADDLSDIPIEDCPRELLQVINSTNTLFSRLESAFRREKQFSSDAAHEIRTPISVLKVHLYNLSEKLPSDPDVIMLQGGFNRLEHLLEQLLALHRSSPDQFSANFEKLNLLELIQSVIAEEFVSFDQKHQDISLKGADTTIIGDKFALETLIKNLLTNANKYTPAEGKIRVSLSNYNTYIHLIVEDSGPGIDNSLFTRVFDRFYRVHSDRHNSGQTGCGLGLSIVKHISELHRAKVKLARSEELGGLKISIIFPGNGFSDPALSSKENQISTDQETYAPSISNREITNVQ